MTHSYWARSPVFLLLLCLARPVWADETAKKDAGGKVRREAGKIVEAGESAGREFGRDASEAGREVKEASLAALDEVRRATREFWRDVLDEKERLRTKLRQENRELRARQTK